MNASARNLQHTIDVAARTLRAMHEERAAHPRAPGKWSPKQIVGHLIDSVSNNHQRFVRAQLKDDMVFPGYEQDAWVAIQRYQDAPWNELVDLWYQANSQLVRVIDAVDAGTLRRLCTNHNLHEIAWESPLPGEPVTLEFFIVDYVNHMKHHLRQIDASLAPAPEAQLPHGRRKSL